MTEVDTHEKLRDDSINIQPNNATKRQQEEKDEDEDLEPCINEVLLETLLIGNPNINFARGSTNKQNKDEKTSRSDGTRDEDHDVDSDSESDDDDTDDVTLSEEKAACLDRMVRRVTDASSVSYSRYSDFITDKK
mmetsp:Transcript_23786/g.36764  ORF Transcript_23786/g.36764 Transcript_23786/m.36764 type:complete len:135 (+) Transcript_23786:153-557(+)|eukprot:CAMPEP_0195304936 /NCGR_PEP_ID=MMETSP0707-20130614/35386_1 /TAXON_ID=33640 /ORGANISM="Asterionellopsis glacialis, Strain CCMP134" /LENGTH=134 /DNA_ID=CAMNT_0040368909 /DNA_START=42 /DNA_END=446 /DNA_ORIENTATION=+